MTQQRLHISIAHGMDGFSAEEWGTLSGTTRSRKNYNPFVSHAFLTALEKSGCVSRATGWLPHHLRMETASGSLAGAIPCYLKSHSQGEYVFDHGWAEAFERAGGRYYPKLQASIPFTPVNGPRLLSTGGDDDNIRISLANGLKSVTQQLDVSSAHVTFLPDAESTILAEADYLLRSDLQYHFFNPGYSSYEAFLGELSSRKRKGLRKERREALASGIDIDWLTGSDLTESVWDDFFSFYMDTADRKWGRPYLNRAFFSLIGEMMADDILLIMAKRAGRYIAGAINFIGENALYGRHWGCVEDHPYLHFEVCYHQAIDYALAHGLGLVEAGAQGEHKLARGYLPVTTHSAHYISHPALRQAVSDFLHAERGHMNEISTYLTQQSAYRKS